MTAPKAAKAALAAAAEVDESEMGKSLALWQKNYGKLQNATIERCAQVAEQWERLEPRQSIVAKEIAAAIRAMKEEG